MRGPGAVVGMFLADILAFALMLFGMLLGWWNDASMKVFWGVYRNEVCFGSSLHVTRLLVIFTINV